MANVLALRKVVVPAAVTINATERQDGLLASADALFKDGSFDPRDELGAIKKGIEAYDLRSKVYLKIFFIYL